MCQVNTYLLLFCLKNALEIPHCKQFNELKTEIQKFDIPAFDGSSIEKAKVRYNNYEFLVLVFDELF